MTHTDTQQGQTVTNVMASWQRGSYQNGDMKWKNTLQWYIVNGHIMFDQCIRPQPVSLQASISEMSIIKCEH